MTALSPAPQPTVTSRIRPLTALAVGFAASLSGLVPAVFLALAF